MVVKSSHIFFVYIGIPADGYPSPAGLEQNMPADGNPSPAG